MSDTSDLIPPGEIAYRLEMTAAQLKVTWTALHTFFDELGHEEHDVVVRYQGGSNAGHTVEERTVKLKEVLEADEVFSSGNYAKVQPCTRVEDRHLQAGPIYKRARELYWEFAHKGT